MTDAPALRLAPNEPVQLDVHYCDLVPPERGETDLQLRFKGVVAEGPRRGQVVRVFVDAAGGAVTMQKHGVLRSTLPELASGETTLPIPLAQKRLTLHRVKSRHGWTSIDIRPRAGGVQAEDEAVLADYRWGFAHARNEFAEALRSDGFPVGATELITIADALATARRRNRQSRG